MESPENTTIEESTTTNNKSRSKCLDKYSVLIYVSHFLSSFGDRVWAFAVSIYLYYLYPGSLLLTAIYGLSTCLSLFIFLTPVGRMIDKSKRLKAARLTILIQNASVVIGAIMMAAAIYYKQDIMPIWNGGLQIVIYAVSIGIAIIAELASMANKIVLEKDWIVILADGNEKKLANLNATMRTINLCCKVIAPLVVGQIIGTFNLVVGAIFMASWNVVSAVAEYYLLYVIFSHIPGLSAQKQESFVPSSENVPLVQISTPEDSPDLNQLKKMESQLKSDVPPPPESMHTPSRHDNAESLTADKGLSMNNNHTSLTPRDGFEEISLVTPVSNKHANPKETPNIVQETRKKPDDKKHKAKDGLLCKSCAGWKHYFSHPVKFAGLALASLYMTVLSFDGVTIGYLSSQGVSAGMVGNLSAAAAAIGVLGSLSFPFFRRKLGKNTTGILGFGIETFCLVLCVASIFAPGSPFDPKSILNPFDTSGRNISYTADQLSLKEIWQTRSNIFLLMAGIATARYGLWVLPHSSFI
ncbi:unnamed protein product [Orchesella dallaii]|uniref:Solute carrier family 40 member n=1 Tax=Orchesella dallaii TaxID=48710 RepID=A0ABP1QDF5_9HEXA